MQFSDPNGGQFGGGNPYGNVGMPYMGTGQARGRFQNRGCRGCLGWLVSLLVLVLILALIGFGFGVHVNGGPTVIKVSAHPTLIIESDSNPGAVIHIHAGGTEGQISILSPHLLNLPIWFPETYQESGDHQIVTYDLQPDASGTIDITVPTQTDLKVTTNDAAVLIEGVTGQMTLVTESGALTVKNSTVSGPALLRSDSGEIQAIQDHLTGAVALDNNGAGITFQGSLDPAGTCRFTEDGGSLMVTLPQSVAVHIDATTNNGSITSNFPGVKAQSGDSGFEIHTNIGSAPRAQLSLYNNGGSITIDEQGGI